MHQGKSPKNAIVTVLGTEEAKKIKVFSDESFNPEYTI